MTDIVVTIHEEKNSQTDRTVPNVIVRDQSIARAITIPAICFLDAMSLAEKIVDALNEHTNMKAEWR